MGRYCRPGVSDEAARTTACRRGVPFASCELPPPPWRLLCSGGDRPCFCTVAEIAARAGTSRTKVQDAIRQAARLGLLTVQERRREGQKNLPNVIRVVSREWLQWLRIGYRKIDPTANKQEREGGAASPRRAFRKEGGARSRPPDRAGEVRPA